MLWADGSSWREANTWLRSRCAECDLTTLQSNAAVLAAYGTWLEDAKISWGHFPKLESERCLHRYRGVLMKAIRSSEGAPSTAAMRMRVLVQFYRWVQSVELISAQWPLWRDIKLGIRIPDAFGFEKSLSVTTTNLRIKNRKSNQDRLEDGLLPLVQKEVDQILVLIDAKAASVELGLMLKLGLGTGMRIGSIADLKAKSLERAHPDERFDGELYRISIGPKANPPVHTKLGVSDKIYISRGLLQEALDYCSSPERINRIEKARGEDRGLVFLTRFGNHYLRNGDARSSAVNVEVHGLRAQARKRGIDLDSFYFHRTRATFGTSFLQFLIACDLDNPVAILREAMLHRSEATSMRYVKFLDKQKKKAKWANEYAKFILGTAPTGGSHCAETNAET